MKKGRLIFGSVIRESKSRLRRCDCETHLPLPFFPYAIYISGGEMDRMTPTQAISDAFSHAS